MVNGEFPANPTGRLLVIVDLLLNNCLHALLRRVDSKLKRNENIMNGVAELEGLLLLLFLLLLLMRTPIRSHFNCRFELIRS